MNSFLYITLYPKINGSTDNGVSGAFDKKKKKSIIFTKALDSGEITEAEAILVAPQIARPHARRADRCRG